MIGFLLGSLKFVGGILKNPYIIAALAAGGLFWFLWGQHTDGIEIAHKAGFDACLTTAREAELLNSIEDLKLARDKAEAETVRLAAIEDQDRKAVEELREFKKEAANEREKAARAIAEAEAGIPDDAWWCASEPVPDSLIDGMRGDPGP